MSLYGYVEPGEVSAAHLCRGELQSQVQTSVCVTCSPLAADLTERVPLGPVDPVVPPGVVVSFARREQHHVILGDALLSGCPAYVEIHLLV